LFNSQLLLRFLGRSDEAIKVSRDHLEQTKATRKTKWIRKLFEYCAGEATEAKLLAATDDALGNRCGAHFCIGITYLAEGQRGLARKHFQSSVDTQCFTYLPYDLSMMFLSRMNQDATWPLWIKQES
jgi:lipoprotein NlpI